MPRVKHWAFPPRLAVLDLTFDLILDWSHLPVWSTFPLCPSFSVQQTSLLYWRFVKKLSLYCIHLTNSVHCGLIAPQRHTIVADPDKAASCVNMNQSHWVQTRGSSCVKSGGAVCLSMWNTAYYLKKQKEMFNLQCNQSKATHRKCTPAAREEHTTVCTALFYFVF